MTYWKKHQIQAVHQNDQVAMILHHLQKSTTCSIHQRRERNCNLQMLILNDMQRTHTLFSPITMINVFFWIEIHCMTSCSQYFYMQLFVFELIDDFFMFVFPLVQYVQYMHLCVLLVFHLL